MSSDLCYKDIKLIPQWLFAANDACFSAPKMDQRKYFWFLGERDYSFCISPSSNKCCSWVSSFCTVYWSWTQTVLVHTQAKNPSCSVKWRGVWWRAKEVNSNGDFLSEAEFHQLDSKIEMFVLPDKAMMFLSYYLKTDYLNQAEINYQMEYIERDCFWWWPLAILSFCLLSPYFPPSRRSQEELKGCRRRFFKLWSPLH